MIFPSGVYAISSTIPLPKRFERANRSTFCGDMASPTPEAAGVGVVRGSAVAAGIVLSGDRAVTEGVSCAKGDSVTSGVVVDGRQPDAKKQSVRRKMILVFIDIDTRGFERRWILDYNSSRFIVN